jgi:putative Mn2+ efflux pump MntP
VLALVLVALSLGLSNFAAAIGIGVTRPTHGVTR